MTDHDRPSCNDQSAEQAMRLTGRGFRIYYEAEPIGRRARGVRVQEGSRAGEGPQAWIFQGEPGESEAVMVTVDEALGIIRGLSQWVDDAVHNRLIEPHFVEGVLTYHYEEAEEP
jgi:hypothetical protein